MQSPTKNTDEKEKKKSKTKKKKKNTNNCKKFCITRKWKKTMAIAKPFALHANAITTEKKLKIKMQYKLANT